MLFKMSFAFNLTFGTIFVLFFIAASIDIVSEKKIITIDCYDQNHHKIIGEVCEAEVFKNESTRIGFLVVMVMCILALPLVPIILMTIDEVRK